MGKVVRLTGKDSKPAVSISALAKKHKVARSTIRDWIAKGTLPVADAPKELPAQKVAPSNPPPATPSAVAATRHPSSLLRLVGAVVLAIAAICIAGLALAINGQYGASIGETMLTSWTFMALAVAVDLLAVALAPAAVGVWRTKQRGLAIATWTIWGVAVSLATLASLGYLQKNLADASATRAAAVTAATATQDQRSEVIAAAKLALSVAKTSREAECATVRGPRCLQREADERTAVNALAAAVASPVVSPAKVSDPDPQIAAVSRLAEWVGLRLKPDDFSNVRLVLWAVILNSGGLVLTIAFGLARRSVRE